MTICPFLIPLALAHLFQATGQRLAGKPLSPQMAQSLFQLLTEERTLRTNLERELQDLEDELNVVKVVK